MNDIEPEVIQRAIAANIRAERARARLSQEEVAVGMQQRGFPTWRQQTAGATERGERRVTADELIVLARVFGVEPEVLWRT